MQWQNQKSKTFVSKYKEIVYRVIHSRGGFSWEWWNIYLLSCKVEDGRGTTRNIRKSEERKDRDEAIKVSKRGRQFLPH